MIRPVTFLCMLMAGGSGLYLYTAKHQAQVLDREIGKTVKQTEAARERIGMLRAEWALLNEPDRLAELARTHTTLQTLAPTQFVALSDLASKLPAPVAASAPRAPTDIEMEDPPAPVAQAAPAPASRPAVAQVAAAPTVAPTPAIATAAPETKPPQAAAEPAATAEAKPQPPHHPARPVQTAVAALPARPIARLAAPVPVAVSNEATAPGTVGAAVLRAMRERGLSEPRPTPAYVQPAYAPAPAYAPPAYPAPAYAAPTTTSLLGGSRGALPPPVPFAVR